MAVGKGGVEAHQMAGVQVALAKHSNLSVVPGLRKAEGQQCLSQVALSPPRAHCGPHTNNK